MEPIGRMAILPDRPTGSLAGSTKVGSHRPDYRFMDRLLLLHARKVRLLSGAKLSARGRALLRPGRVFPDCASEDPCDQPSDCRRAVSFSGPAWRVFRSSGSDLDRILRLSMRPPSGRLRRCVREPIGDVLGRAILLYLPHAWGRPQSGRLSYLRLRSFERAVLHHDHDANSSGDGDRFNDYVRSNRRAWDGTWIGDGLPNSQEVL